MSEALIFEVGQKQKQMLRVLASKARAVARSAKTYENRKRAEGRAEAFEAAIRLVERTT